MSRFFPAIGTLFLLTGLLAAVPQTVGAKDARAFVANLGNQAIQVLGPSVSPKITDVYVGGVSMKVTQRDEFSSVIQRNGGRVDALLAQLRQRLAAAR